MSYSTVSPQTLYKAKPEFQTKLVKARQYLHQRLKPHLNQTVRVQTMDHQVYEGTIVHMDADHLYIKVPQPYHPPSPANPTLYRSSVCNNVILPLVLFTLLVVILLS
ncbi:hypothetical protein ACFQ5D_14540 [Paenibacillus farraposensis]|uniref:Acetyl-CoA acetyltransferase n=1 Tax=Paenibacillus farraposensis TaxID=2807095 RepID=A0ABW4DDI4_9BACL|nr:hypothetical protein [Paenibacillus farraposensis]MCC3381995.1 hypothetical protein [Paenibacillus farraposensis]